MATMELRRPTSSAVDDLDYNHFKRRVRERTGIDLASYKPDQMRRRLRTLMQRSHARTFTEYFRLLDRDPEKLREFQAFFTINVSELFRNPEKFDVLRRVVLPDLLNRHARLRVWSAGCSYGAEAYSIAILLKELAPRSRHYILATDVDESVLTRAQAADSYSEQDLRNVDPDRRQRHFTQTADGPWAINRDIRSMVTIRRHDVLHDAFEAHFNLIVCRNVVIYFTEDAKQKLYRRLWQALSPGGYLFVGATEIVTNTAAIGFSSDLLSFYRKDPNATPKGELTRAN